MLHTHGRGCASLLIAWTLLSCQADTRVEQLHAPRNPTTYRFHRTPAELGVCLKRLATDGLWIRDQRLVGQTYDEHFSEVAEIFSQAPNRSDVVFHNYWEILGTSEVYHTEGRFLPYRATFHAHIDSGSNPPVTVTVRPLTFEVRVGTSWAIGHAGKRNVYRSVPGTTIDEYRILLAIGSCLGISDMPALSLPGAAAAKLQPPKDPQ
jgi:hypothetical protein